MGGALGGRGGLSGCALRLLPRGRQEGARAHCKKAYANAPIGDGGLGQAAGRAQRAGEREASRAAAATRQTRTFMLRAAPGPPGVRAAPPVRLRQHVREWRESGHRAACLGGCCTSPRSPPFTRPTPRTAQGPVPTPRMQACVCCADLSAAAGWVPSRCTASRDASTAAVDAAVRRRPVWSASQPCASLAAARLTRG